MNNKTELPLVSILCTTYNHEKYIRQCLEGFIIQKTNFPIEIIIHDDASKDKTKEIILEYINKYPDLFIPILQKENQFSKGINIINDILIPKSRGKYIAICEGDDYWIEPLKLQLQVDFLETHPDYGFLRTNVNAFYQEKNIYDKEYFSHGFGLKIKDTLHDTIMYGWFTAPCTWIFRSSLVNIQDIDKNKYFKGDIFLQLMIYSKSKAAYINKTTAVYRILSSSASHGLTTEKRLRFWIKNKNTRMYYAKQQSLQFKIKFWFVNLFIRFRCFKFNFNKYPYLLSNAINDLVELFSK